ncbi:glycosyltransferase family 9 protein [Azospirillum sp. TSH64]|uniref:glycosyltransferase family 9 protein n=1 Tax=Azospirillum sp. TSH64 TaxID=652740 RepID=UPI0011B28437|nr:glycosyltransferase family 9 protein [Azospirillum sp. TSH64]
MVYFVENELMPPPQVVLDDACQHLARLSERGARILIAPHCDLVTVLYLRGAFLGTTILGTLDRNVAKRGEIIGNLDVFAYDDIERLRPDAVVVAHTRYGGDILRTLTPEAQRLGFELVSLCDRYDQRAYRSELAAHLDFRQTLAKRVGEDQALPRDLTITIPAGWGLGDRLCALSTAREFSRRFPMHRVHFRYLKDIATAYSDTLLIHGHNGLVIPENSSLFHRQKDTSPAGNYLGCYYLGIGLDFDALPNLDLPLVPPLPGLEPGRYAVLQTAANWARPNLSNSALQQIIDQCPLPVVLVGKPDQSIALQRVIPLGMGDEMTMLRAVRHARLVMAPRSASAHIASAYRVPSVIWVPDDGENWHLDYPGWPHTCIRAASEQVVEQVTKAVVPLL